MTGRKHVVIVGGGSGGISVAARLMNADRSLEITIIEPSARHFYQPLWTLVGAGIFPKEKSMRAEASLIPPGANWLQDSAQAFLPDQQIVQTTTGKMLNYDFLVVASGMQLDWQKIKGLTGAIGRDGICSNYSYETVSSTWNMLQSFKGGVALFTQPSSAIKCGGAPQKICYLAEEHFRRSGVRNQTRIIFASGTPSIFAVPKYAEVLQKVVQRKNIQTRFLHDLIEVRPAQREAVFRHAQTGEESTIQYDLLHVTPPMSAPDFIKQSPLADAAGWVDVDKATLQHKRYPNVFGIGDVTNLPTSKTGAAIRKQAPVLTANLLAQTRDQALGSVYDGYTSCPVVTGYDRLILAEFDYEKKPRETFPFNQAKERYSMFLLKAYGLPTMYWNGMLRGRL